MKTFLEWMETHQPGSGWDRFKDFVGSASWDHVVEAGLGDPTPEEVKAIMQNDLWGRAITKNSIDILKGKSTSPNKNYSIVSRCIDGTDEEEFDSIDKVKDYIKGRMGNDFVRMGDDSFRTSYCNYQFIGFTFQDIGMDPNRP